MIFQDIEFHNVSELKPVFSGWQMLRYPQEVRTHMGSGAHRVDLACGCEIRFVTEAPRVSVTLSVPETEGEILVFRGDYFHSLHRLQAGTIRTITLDDHPIFGTLRGSDLQESRYSSKMWRIFAGHFSMVFHALDCYGFSYRPPQAEEAPRLRWLAYGSSITTGIGATHLQHAYVHQAARRLRADVLNKGLPGAYMCEREVSDFLADQNDWNMITLEIGVNMRGIVSPELFEERADYMIRRLTTAHPDKPVVIFTVFPNFSTYEREQTILGIHEAKYNEILRRLVRDAGLPNLNLLEGADILSDFGGLTVDLIHPSDSGHALMGDNLARLCGPILSPKQHADRDRCCL